MKQKKLLKIAIYLFLFGLLTGIGIVIYVFNKPHRNIAKEKPAFVLTANVLIGEFEQDEQQAYQKYGDKTILVKGVIADVASTDSSLSISLQSSMNGVSCTFNLENLKKFAPEFSTSEILIGDSIAVKGKCDGYDMIMGVVLTQCVVIK